MEEKEEKEEEEEEEEEEEGLAPILIFVNKNTFYKNIQAEIFQKIRTSLRTIEAEISGFSNTFFK